MLHKCQRLNLKRNARSNVRNRKNIHHSWFDINVTQLLLMSWNLFDHPEKPQTVQCFQLKDEGNITRTLIYFMFKWTKQTLQPRRERENVHFLQHDNTEADFFQRCVLQNGLKCKAFKCKSMAFVFTWSTHILYNSTTMFRRTETTSSTIFDTQF